MIYDVHYFFESDKESVTAWVAIAISVLALAATLYQAHLSRNHNRLMVRPHLAGHGASTGDVYSLTVRNDGLGPAWITGARLYRDGKLLDGEGASLIDQGFAGISGCVLRYREFFYSEYVLPAGQEIRICEVVYDPRIRDVDSYLANILYLEIDYRDAYGKNCVTYSSRRVEGV